MSYQVKLEVFEGPFDLLLHLIARREVDVYEVSLGQITEEYLGYLRRMQDLDLEIATEFLVVAATLIEIKAARLLPGPPTDDEQALQLSERDVLIARLLEYRGFKEAAESLVARLEANAGYYGRSAGPGPEWDHIAPDLMARTSLERLAALAARALAPRPVQRLDLSHITPIRVTVAAAVRRVMALLAERRSVSFSDLAGECGSRIEIVVRFLAVLELLQRGEAEVEQRELFGAIEIRRSDTTEPAGDFEVDEYDGEAKGAAAALGGDAGTTAPGRSG